MCRESGTPYQGQPASSQGQVSADQGQSVSGQDQVVKSVGKQDQPVVQEAKSKQDKVSTGLATDKEELVKKGAPAIQGRGRGASHSQTSKDEMPSESTLAKKVDSAGLEEQPQPKSSSAAAAGSTPAKALGQQPAGDATSVI